MKLSRAEQAVADYMKKGLANKDIADRLCVSEKTVKFHITNIYQKKGCKTRAEFIVKEQGNLTPQTEVQKFEEIYSPPKIEEPKMLETGSKPLERIMPINEARAIQDGRPLQQGARQVQVVQKSQEDKITFIDDKFKVGETITQLHQMMKDVTSKELTPNTVNAACNCVARLNETIHTAIQAARFLNER
ncbi:MAG: helix-turn-helix domain-containing protein [Pseudobdellovibrionaceae bacterium]